MNPNNFILYLVLTIVTCSCTTRQSDIENDFVENLISTMTVDEKIGQMTQIAVDLIMDDDQSFSINEEKLRRAIIDKKIGSIINVKWQAYTLDQYHQLITSIQDIAVRETSKSIPVLYGIDAIHGANYIIDGTIFPHNLGMAATRNLSLAKQMAKITAAETRASGVRWNFDPVVGVGRQPLWSRLEETFGEDTYLVGEMGESIIRGYEEDGLNKITAVASCAKHYMGYSVPQSGKDRTPAYIPINQLRNIYLPPFQKAINANTSSVMINSGELNGTPLHASKFYLQTILRDELGFNGLIVSDWEDIIRLFSRHKVAQTPKEAVKIAVNAGIDMSMVPLDYSFYDLLLELVNDGEVPETRINDAVRRILKLKYKLGLFSNPYPETDALDNFAKPSYYQAAKQAALESITLLKNDNNILPISKEKKILLAGPAANNITSMHSSWSYSWQGNNANLYPESTISIKEALQLKIGNENIITNTVQEYQSEINFDSEKLLKDAENVDLIVLCLGENAYAESPGVIDDLTLDEKQLKLAKTAISTGKPVVLVLIEGRPRIISSIEKGIDGIIMGYRPGKAGAEAIVDVLVGDYNPSGILPITYPKSTGDIVFYDHKYAERGRADKPDQPESGYSPQWEFGHGLSYTTFEFDEISINKNVFKIDEDINVDINIKNTGLIPGDKNIELYSKDLFASITPSFKKLRAFQKVNVQPGEVIKVNFKISTQDLSFVNEENIRVTEPGMFELEIAGKSILIEIK